MFALSKRAGRLADRVGPRLFMGFGPLVSALGLGLMLRIDAHLNYFTDLLPALLIFSLGLAATVAPLTATVLADADESNAGIASGVNNAIARIAGLLAVAAIGAVVAAQFNASLDESLAGQTLPAPARSAVEQARKETLASVDPAVTGTEVAEDVESASSEAFHVGIGISTVLVALGGLLGLAGIRNPRRVVRCQDCAGGQLAGQPLDSARERRTLSEPAGSGA
jgi:MFS family permease